MSGVRFLKEVPVTQSYRQDLVLTEQNTRDNLTKSLPFVVLALIVLVGGVAFMNITKPPDDDDDLVAALVDSLAPLTWTETPTMTATATVTPTMTATPLPTATSTPVTPSPLDVYGPCTLAEPGQVCYNVAVKTPTPVTYDDCEDGHNGLCIKKGDESVDARHDTGNEARTVRTPAAYPGGSVVGST